MNFIFMNFFDFFWWFFVQMNFLIFFNLLTYDFNLARDTDNNDSNDSTDHKFLPFSPLSEQGNFGSTFKQKIPKIQNKMPKKNPKKFFSEKSWNPKGKDYLFTLDQNEGIAQLFDINEITEINWIFLFCFF